jgi:uncharacterized protein (TIGR00730 family)
MKSLAIYCGSSPGHDPKYSSLAYDVGRHLAENEITLVYGGGKNGMMGAVANGALEAGGRVIGVIPDFLQAFELGHDGCTELHVVSSMHIRKTRMAELSEGFIALPGGFGTLEEIFEIVTWSQLGHHAFPCGVLDFDGFYTPLLQCLDGMVTQGFMRQADRDRLISRTNLTDLLQAMKAWVPPVGTKWEDPMELNRKNHF